MEIKLGSRLRELRNAKSLSQIKLAESLNLSKSFVADIEIGKSSVSIETLVLLADYFGVTTDYLLGRE